MTADLGEDLRAHVFMAYADASPAARRCSRWVMSDEWFHEIRKLDDGRGPLWYPQVPLGAPETLLGLPVEIRNDGGVPHLEPGS